MKPPLPIISKLLDHTGPSSTPAGPGDHSGATMPDTIEDLLSQLGLVQYRDVFADNGVDLAALALLNEGDLQDLGVLLGHRKKLLRAIGTGAGSPLPVTGPSSSPDIVGDERRQLTVMFCDLVSFTELAARVDPEVLQRIIRTYEEVCAVCIARYEGYVAKHLGDGIVAFFGYPLAHEGEAERAILAGLDIIEALSELDVPDAGLLAVRIGIATGLVVVSSADKDAWGETMNVASRLQGIAKPGSVVVTDRVQRLATGAFQYDDMGGQTLKGIPQPVQTYRVVGARRASSRFDAATQQGLTTLVGREQEIGLLLERWALARDGEGQVVLLSGEPGIGKSRVLSALSESLQRQGTQIMRFQCSPYYMNSALWPSIESFERTLKFGRDEAPESKLDKLENLMVGHSELAQTDVPLMAAILSIPYEERYGPIAMTPQHKKNETLRTLVDITEATARRRPTVMFYEDLHWADPTSLEALELLIDRVQSVPLLVVLTFRPEFQPKWGGHGHVAALNLSKLTRGQSGEIVSALAGGKELPDGLVERILAKTDGVPLYVEELTKAILESGELVENDDHFDYAGAVRDVTIPATLRDSLMSRLDRFTPVKEIAQIGAVIGRSFSYELIAALAPHDEAELDRALDQLTESGLAIRRGEPPAATYTFKHALVQDAAYDSLLKSRRQALHLKTARVLEKDFPSIIETEPELLAHHLTVAGQAGPAIDYWIKAGTMAFKRLALKEALSHFHRGLELVGSLPPSSERDAKELDLRTLHGTASLALEGWQSAAVWTSLQPALELAKSLGRREALMPIYWGLWVYVLTQGRIDETQHWVDDMLATARHNNDHDLLMTGHRAASVTSYYLGDFTACSSHGDRVLELYDADKHHYIADVVNTDPKTAVGIFVSAATWMLGYPDRAVQLSEAKDAHARQRGHPFDLGYALTWGGQVFELRSEPDALLARVEEAERLGRTYHLPFISEVLAQLMKGLAWLRAGRLAEGTAQFRDAMGRWSAGGGLALMPYFRATLAECFALSGDIDEGFRLLEESLEQIARPGWGERSHLAEVLRLKGWMQEQRGEFESAEANYLASLTVSRQQQARSWELRTATSLARLRRSRGDPTGARQVLAPVYDWFTEGFGTRDLRQAKALLDELAPTADRKTGNAGTPSPLNSLVASSFETIPTTTEKGLHAHGSPQIFQRMAARESPTHGAVACTRPGKGCR